MSEHQLGARGSSREHQRVEQEIAKLRSDLPDNLKLKEAELSAEQRRLANFVDFIGEGRGSQALARAPVETERQVETLADEVDALSRSRQKVFQAQPVEWITDRLENLHEVLEHRTARSAKVLRDILGPIRLDLVTPDIGRPFYRAITVAPPPVLAARRGPRFWASRDATRGLTVLPTFPQSG